jgi:hypothetical protein
MPAETATADIGASPLTTGTTQMSLEDLIAGGIAASIEVGPYSPQVDIEKLLASDANSAPVVVNPDGSVSPVDPDPTIGEVLTDQVGALAEEPYVSGFTMTDEPVLPPEFLNTSPADGVLPPSQQTSATETQQGGVVPPGPTPPAGAVSPADEDIISPRERRLAQGQIRYEGRIRVLEAFQYLGRLDSAPAWVDRNWLAHGDVDDLRKIPAGPMLRVPVPNTPNFALCRIGDYVCQQEIVLDVGVPSAVRVEVWAKDDFQKNFMAVANE